MLRFFCDYHHDGLYHSLHLLLEKRLGHELYRPIGMDWFEEGFWEIARPYGNDPRTAAQFLDVNNITWDSETNLNGSHKLDGNVYSILQPQLDFWHKAITLETFKNMKFDVIIASYIDHIKPYADLIKKFQPQAKLVHQMGNSWANRVDFGIVKNILASTASFVTSTGMNAMFYRQEFPIDIFYPTSHSGQKRISSFVHCLPMPGIYQNIQGQLPEYEMKAYGASAIDGTIGKPMDIANIMRSSMFGYHYKPGADGYGHILHNWFAVGRPVIINYDEYKSTLGGTLLTPDVTCIALNPRNIKEACDKIRYFSEPARYKTMCENVQKRFKEKVDFDEDAKKVAVFLENLI